MIEQNNKKKLVIMLILMCFFFTSSINSFLKAIDKGATWRMILSGIPMVMFPILIIMILIKLYKLNKNK